LERIENLLRGKGGVLERFPNLKLLVLEVGAGWVPHFIERMDAKWEHSGFMTACKRPPSEYFRMRAMRSWVLM
jgi:predicted TIM-barrel fold metal-dependent hydrolase